MREAATGNVFPQSSGASNAMRRFDLIGLAPPGLVDPAIAIGAARAGGMGLLDLEYIDDTNRAVKAVEEMVRHAGGVCGVRLYSLADSFIAELLPRLPDGVGFVVFTQAYTGSLFEHVKSLHRAGRLVWIEVTSVEEAMKAEHLGADGLLVKGNEAAGMVGEKTSFVLLQQILPKTTLPVWVQGGIGLHTAAAAYAAGAAGAVLDSQLILTRESALPEGVKERISRMDGSETVCIGGEGSGTLLCRMYISPGSTVRSALLDLSMEAGKATDDKKPEVYSLWHEAVRTHLGWREGRSTLWLVGQDVACASRFAERFRTVGSVFRAIRRAVDDHIRTARLLRPLDAESPLARSHGTLYPIVQGPMARVSDNAAFTACVAEGGALPVVALSVLDPGEIREMLKEVRERVGGRPWGVGLLGFIEEDLLRAQIEALKPFSPPFAVVAGGRPNQVAELESMGTNTYVHVQSPAILDMFIDSGARRFIFEGSECGGHIGPRSSFVLWEEMIERLMEVVKGEAEPEAFHILFAGGIHDAVSAAMVSTMAAPLAGIGVRVGVLMGTAYLFTEEIIRAGGIVKEFQSKAIHCSGTDVLESGPGHAVRCLPTPFARTFAETKKRLLKQSLPPEEVRERLEDLIRGRSRIASKGVKRNPSFGSRPDEPYLVKVSERTQHKEGLYMAGQVAALRNKTTTVKDLHNDVSVGSSEILSSLPIDEDGIPSQKPSDIAIVGMSCILPKAGDLRIYWENILDKVDAITEVPPDRWDWRLYFDEDSKARDKIYSRWGGFLDDIVFDPVTYGMPPNSLRSIEPLHLLALEGVRHALKDAGYENRDFDRENTSVIVGTGGGIGELGQNYVLRSGLPTFIENPEEIFKKLPEWTEDSFPGILMNVLAGRIANRFNLGGVNYTVDAACASSLAALYDAVRELECGTSDMVIVGGADAGQNPFAYFCFCKTHALSSTGRCRVFDEKADGTVISEGLCFLVLKRLEDAERDGDRIYAVIKSVAGASDGRQKGMTAPNPMGQLSALKRAYKKAGFSPSTVELLEAHGTGTVVGDRVEAESANLLLKEHNAPYKKCAIGSVKSMIGHTKGAAGLAGLIKAALALHHKVLPPTADVERPNSMVGFRNGAIYVNTEARPWIRDPAHPRRAGVNAFGFGGTNFHAVLEEYETAYAPSGRRDWGSELFIWAGESRSALADSLKAFGQRLAGGHGLNLADLAYTVCTEYEKNGTAACRLAIVASSVEDLVGKIGVAREYMGTNVDSLSDPRGIYFSQRPVAAHGKVAFLFPGQGSQYPGMVKELAMYFHEVRHALERADASLKGAFPRKLSSYIFPAPSFSPEEEKECRVELAATNIAQPALGAVSVGVLHLLESFGLLPDLAAGHSYGEYTALYSAGVIEEDALYRISEARGRSIIEAAGGEDLGTMAAVKADSSEVEAVIRDIDGVVIANMNSPSQTVISGTREAVSKAVEVFEARHVQAQHIPVSAAFHSQLVAPAKERFSAFLSTVNLSVPSIDVFSNNSAAPHKGAPEAIRKALVEHIVRPVRFVDEIEAMYEAGARVFVEVGPGSVLTNLTRQILEGMDFLAVSTDTRGSGLQQFLKALGQLAVSGIGLELGRLYKDRDVRLVDLENPVAEEVLTPTAWLVNGSGARPAGTQPRTAADTERVSIGRGGQAQIPAPSSFAEPAMRDAAMGGQRVDDVMLRFQQMMARFLETQRNVMTAYLGGAPAQAHEGSRVPEADPAVSEALRQNRPLLMLHLSSARLPTKRHLQPPPSQRLISPRRTLSSSVFLRQRPRGQDIRWRCSIRGLTWRPSSASTP